MNLIENIYLKEWIDINYPEMIKNGAECLCELDYIDMDKFSFWLQDKIYQGAMKEAYSQFQDAAEYHGFK